MLATRTPTTPDRVKFTAAVRQTMVIRTKAVRAEGSVAAVVRALQMCARSPFAGRSAVSLKHASQFVSDGA